MISVRAIEVLLYRAKVKTLQYKRRFVTNLVILFCMDINSLLEQDIQQEKVYKLLNLIISITELSYLVQFWHSLQYIKFAHASDARFVADLKHYTQSDRKSKK